MKGGDCASRIMIEGHVVALRAQFVTKFAGVPFRRGQPAVPAGPPAFQRLVAGTLTVQGLDHALNRSPQRPTDSVAGFLYQSSGHVGVGLFSDPSAGVPQQLGNHLHRHTLLKQQSSRGVA